MASGRSQIYAFTHALIYLTHFGNTTPEFPRPKFELISDAECALARSIDEDDFDVAAELLMTWPYLKQKWNSTAIFALNVINRVHNDLGILPALGLNKETFSSLTKEERRNYIATGTYHTALVMGLLSASLLLPDCAPPQAISDKATTGNWPAIFNLLPKRTPQPQWEIDFAELSEQEKERLTNFLITASLRRAMTLYDFQRFNSILNESINQNIILLSSVQQGANLIKRFSSSTNATSKERIGEERA